jgi:hypothetical protein
MPSRLLVVCLSVAVAAAALSCLPRDTRPPPASVLVTVTANEELLGGISSSATLDGWSVGYQRFLVSLGGVSLDGKSCTTYSEAGYGRILDVQDPDAQKLSISYALGQCDFGFRVSNPSTDSLLGQGVTEEDKTFMRTPGTDLYSLDQGVSIYVQGTATKNDVSKHFAWSFRQRVRYEKCEADVDGTRVEGLGLGQRDAVTVEIRMHGEALLQDNLDPTRAKLRFDALAAADTTFGNDDGEVTLTELGQVKLSDVGSASAYVDGDGGTAEYKTLEDYLYLGLFPAIARYRGDGMCTVSFGLHYD